MKKKNSEIEDRTRDQFTVVVEAVKSEIRIFGEVFGARLDKIESRLDKIETRLDKVEARLDEMDTKIDNLRDEMNEKIDDLRDDMNGNFRKVFEMVDVVDDEKEEKLTAKVSVVDFVKLEKRVEKLEKARIQI